MLIRLSNRWVWGRRLWERRLWGGRLARQLITSARQKPALLKFPFSCIPLFALLCGIAWAADFPRRLPTTQRLRIRQLKYTHEAADALRNTFRPLNSPYGLHDLRAVIHAHSELSYDSPGTLQRLVRAAKKMNVKVVMMTEHPFNPKLEPSENDRDVLERGLRGIHDGVLFIPGTEEQNLLTFPTRLKHLRSPMSRQQRIDHVANQTGGLVFVAHPEEISEWDLSGFHGMEIYNAHADLKDEPDVQKMLGQALEVETVLKLYQAFKLFPAESTACIMDGQPQVLKQWDKLTLMRRVVGIAGNDAHENSRFVMRKKSDTEVEIFDISHPYLRTTGVSRGVIDVRTITRNGGNGLVSALSEELMDLLLARLKQRGIGERLMSATVDRYERTFHLVSTHVLAREQSETAVREALARGHCYVCFDWIADPTGTSFRATDGVKEAIMGDEILFSPTLGLEFRTTVEVNCRLLRNGTVVHSELGRTMRFPVTEPGVYRVECWANLAGEDRPWLYTNPIYIR